MAFNGPEPIWVLGNPIFYEIIRQTQIPFEGDEGLEGDLSGLGHHKEACEPLD